MGVGAWVAVPVQRFLSPFLLSPSSPLVLVAAGADISGVASVTDGATLENLGFER